MSYTTITDVNGRRTVCLSVCASAKSNSCVARWLAEYKVYKTSALLRPLPTGLHNRAPSVSLMLRNATPGWLGLLEARDDRVTFSRPHCNVVFRTVCSLYFNEIQRLSSAHNILPWHTSYIDVKRTFWSFFNSLLPI